MALFSKKENTDEATPVVAETPAQTTEPIVTESTPVAVQLDAKASRN